MKWARSFEIFFNSCFTVWPFCLSSLLSFFWCFLQGFCCCFLFLNCLLFPELFSFFLVSSLRFVLFSWFCVSALDVYKILHVLIDFGHVLCTVPWCIFFSYLHDILSWPVARKFNMDSQNYGLEMLVFTSNWIWPFGVSKFNFGGVNVQDPYPITIALFSFFPFVVFPVFFFFMSFRGLLVDFSCRQYFNGFLLRVTMEVIVTIVSKLVYFTCLGDIPPISRDGNNPFTTTRY